MSQRKSGDRVADIFGSCYLDATFAVVGALCKQSGGRDRVGAGKSLADGRDRNHDGLLEHGHDGDDEREVG